MRVLISNDDGPPGEASPFILSFVQTLQRVTDWEISVCIPNTQKSWIGKAFHLTELISASYYHPPPRSETPSIGDAGEVYSAVAPRDEGDWVLLNGTPATAVNIGVHGLFTEKYDLVLSGPNFGRNSSAVFTLGSGTIGGAMEAAITGHRAIALSYAFFDRHFTANLIRRASEVSVKVITKLAASWNDHPDVQLYNINIPLIEELPHVPIYYTQILQNKWGSCFEEIDPSHTGPISADKQEEKTRAAPEEGMAGTSLVGNSNAETSNKSIGRQWKWKPSFSTVYKSVEDAGPEPLTDGWAIAHKTISVTPLKANFMHATGPYKGELKL